MRCACRQIRPLIQSRKNLAMRKQSGCFCRRSITISARTLDGNPFDYWTRFDLTIALMVTGNLTEAKRHLTIAIQGLQSRSPLEIFLADLRRMKTAPFPPANADELIEQAQQG